jgi:hypothetical protein
MAGEKLEVLKSYVQVKKLQGFKTLRVCKRSESSEYVYVHTYDTDYLYYNMYIYISIFLIV